MGEGKTAPERYSAQPPSYHARLRANSGGKGTVMDSLGRQARTGPPQPRTHHSTKTPSTAAPRPTPRNRASGACAISAAARRVAPGKAAKVKPSSASKSPSAAIRSPTGNGLAASLRRRRRLAALGIVEVAEEVGVGRQQEPRIVLLQARLVGLHRAVEGEEVRVPPVGFGEDAVALGVAFAAHLLAARRGVGDEHGDVAVGARPDALGELAAAAADLGGLALALGLHALEHRLAVGLGQVGAADAHVDHRDAEV